MGYKIKMTGEHVRLDVLANADQSMVGLQTDNSRIISMHYSEFLDLVTAVLGEREINNFELTTFKYHVFPIQQANGEINDSIIVLETIEDVIEAETVLDMLKLFQSSDIFSCYLFSYRVSEGKLCGGGIGKIFIREHAINYPYKPYQMTDESRAEFQPWIDTHREILSDGANEKYSRMKRLYLDSYLLDDADQAFAMLSIVLEMLVDSTSELQYRISRCAAVFLSKSRSEMKEIFQSVKRLYGIRSKYVHEGKRVSWDNLFELRELARRVIVLMYEKGMHRKGFDFRAFSTELTYDGYAQE